MVNCYSQSCNLTDMTYSGGAGVCSSQATLFNNLIWGIDDVCEFTRYAKGTIYNFVSRGEIPYRRGRKKKLIFILGEIMEWLRGD